MVKVDTTLGVEELYDNRSKGAKLTGRRVGANVKAWREAEALDSQVGIGKGLVCAPDPTGSQEWGVSANG